MRTILISSDCFLPRWDGIAKFLSELIPEINDEFKIILAIPDFGRIPKYKNVEVHKFPLIKIQFGDIFFSKVNNFEIKDLVERCDFVFNQTLGPIGMKAIKYAKKINKPVIGYVHSLDWELASEGVKYFKLPVKIFMKLLVRKLYNKCNLLLLPSKEMEDLLTVQGIRSKKDIVKLGVDTKRFKPANRTSAKKKIGLNPSDFVIGFCGRLSREKDLPTLFEAFKKVNKKYKNTKLLIIGEGPQRENLKHPNVILKGSKNNVVPYLQAMDVYVLPSLTETSSLSTMEAMSCGLPVIVTPVGNIKEYVIDKETGLLFPRGDVNNLKDKIKYLMKREELRTQLGIAARKKIQERHDWKNTVTEIKRILMEF
ncbi:glycosyltransferase family 4 protein [archaeon]|nr:glycosyltransferase family 4 protein [archaeon]